MPASGLHSEEGPMNPKKTKEKERRRARKLAEEAWEAANDQNLDLAEKIICRAVATQPDNPVLWNDQGMLLLMRGKGGEAEEAFRTAISLAPSYAEPFAQLAAMRAKQGCFHDAVPWMEKAVRFAPESVPYAERLDTYRALVQSASEAVAPVIPIETPKIKPTEALSALPREVAAFDRRELG